jgi:RHS repeat-associated protein
MTDSAGAVKERYDYGPYGNVTILDGEGNALEQSSIGNAITYTGQRYDADTGLYYYKNRYYSPKLGRFLSKDPLGMIDGPNLYAYVNNDPTNWVDPMGTTILPWGDENGTDDDVYIEDPVGDIFGIPSGDPEMDDVAISENGAMNSGQSAGDCPFGEERVVYVGFGYTVYMGGLVPPGVNPREYAPAGIGREKYVGVAYETCSGDHKFFISEGRARPDDVVSGVNVGAGYTFGGMQGGFEDFFGESRVNTGTVVIGLSDSENSEGARGRAVNYGIGVGCSATEVTVDTRELTREDLLLK